jgi:small subunit ribosomal protein S20
MRDSPVANEKKAVLRASRPRRRGRRSGIRGRPARAPLGAGASPASRSAGTGALDYAAAAAPVRRGFDAFMANIASQEKRIHRAERERLENRRYTSQVKTYFRRLEAAVEAKDAERADSELRALASRVDRAVTRGALHRNNGARKKARAARIRAAL